MIRHHRKLLRRLRSLYPANERRSVMVFREAGGRWCVAEGRLTHEGYVIHRGRLMGIEDRRARALQEAIRCRSIDLFEVCMEDVLSG